MNHKITPERRFATATLALADVKETGKKARGDDQRHGAGHVHRRAAYVAVAI